MNKFIIPVSIRNVFLEKSLKVFSKHSTLKYNQYCQGYIHFSNRRHTKNITLVREKVLTRQNQFEF